VSAATGGEGDGANVSEDSMGDKSDCVRTRLLLCVVMRTRAVFLREPLGVTCETPVLYAVHIVAPLPLLYAINQVQLKTHNHIMQRVPWEREISADLFICDAVGKDGAASAGAWWMY
jgi:hypothetical protein